MHKMSSCDRLISSLKHSPSGGSFTVRGWTTRWGFEDPKRGNHSWVDNLLVGEDLRFDLVGVAGGWRCLSEKLKVVTRLMEWEYP